MSIDEMIDRIEMYVTKRQLGIAGVMAAEFLNESSTSPLKEAGYAILSVIVSYFEMIAQFINGEDSKNKSKPFFVQGFRAVYPTTSLSDVEIQWLYEVVRCGMYHGGMTKSGTRLSRYFSTGFTLQGGEVWVNPGRAVEELNTHFAGYVRDLRNPANARERSLFERVCRLNGVDLPISDLVSVPSGSSTCTPKSTTPAPWHPGDGKQH
jgi:hypothetical protein